MSGVPYLQKLGVFQVGRDKILHEYKTKQNKTNQTYTQSNNKG